MSELVKGFNPQDSLFFQRTKNEPGRMLERLRRRAEISRPYMSDALGMEPSLFHRIESGERYMPWNIEFYENARDVLQGPKSKVLATDAEISALVRTEKSPRYLVSKEPTLKQAAATAFGECFRNLRTRARLTEADTAKIFVRDRTLICRVETGWHGERVEDNYFYDETPNALKPTESEYAKLLLSGQPPRWLVPNLYAALEQSRFSVRVNNQNGQRFNLEYYLNASDFTADSLLDIDQVVEGLFNLHFSGMLVGVEDILHQIGIPDFKLTPLK
jgi:transcriptional regulator with XRE-family HTH domain